MSVLNNPVLILNNSWIAIRVRNIKTAIKLAARERACIVDPVDYAIYTWDEWVEIIVKEGDSFIRAVRKKIKAPDVILLTKYNKVPSHDVKLTKRNIFIRDGYRCQYSGERVDPKDADIDHIVPVSKGGKTVWTNLVVASKHINRKKGNKSLEESGFELLKKPKKPNAQSILFDPRKEIPETWKKFI